MCGSRRGWLNGNRSRCSSGPRTRRDTRSTSRASTAPSAEPCSAPARRSACTSHRAACGRTSSAARWPFWQHFFPKLQQRFPSQLGDVTLDSFFRGINKVQRSLIRVESDEATYNLHIMLRVEMEIAMLDGRRPRRRICRSCGTRACRNISASCPDSDAKGILQDIHWSIGAMGYFATYTLGNLISAQLWEALRSREPRPRRTDIGRGDFSALLAWLRTNVHQYGRKYQPQELVERVTGSRIDPEPYLRYLEQKYRGVYGLGVGSGQASGLGHWLAGAGRESGSSGLGASAAR